MKHQNLDHSIRQFENFSPQLGKNVFVDKTATVIGQVTIGDDSSIWPLVAIRGDMHSISIGKRTNIQDGSVLHITHAGPFNEVGCPLIIGDECTIGHGVILHGCTIHNRVLIGMGATIMDGSVIPDNVVIGANSLVPPNKQLESGFLYKGSPAQKIRPLTEKEISFFEYSANNYCKYKDRFLNDQ